MLTTLALLAAITSAQADDDAVRYWLSTGSGEPTGHASVKAACATLKGERATACQALGRKLQSESSAKARSTQGAYAQQGQLTLAVGPPRTAYGDILINGEPIDIE